MRSTRAQRIAAQVALGVSRGLSEEDATAAAYESEGMPPPEAPKDLEGELEEALWKLHCAQRQANLVTARAAKLAVENRALRAERDDLVRRRAEIEKA